jgi:hypothetical protein
LEVNKVKMSMGSNKLATMALILALVISLSVPLLPFLINGAPLIGDSWAHMSWADEIVDKGIYDMGEPNSDRKWPLVNFLLAFINILTDIPIIYSSQLVPLLVGFSGLPFYLLGRRVGLSRGAAIFSILFLVLNPLYSYITFSGVIMKETSTYYIINSILLLWGISVGEGRFGRFILTSMILGMGVVLGHHYGALITFLFAISFYFFVALQELRGLPVDSRVYLYSGLSYWILFLSWNIMNTTILGGSFRFLDIGDGLILPAILLLVVYILQRKEGLLSRRIPLLIGLSYILAILGLRWDLYYLLQPIPPMTIYEIRNYLVAGLVGIFGLSSGLGKVRVRALAASVVTMSLFPPLWGISQTGFTMMIKSLHYLGPLLALGGGFSMKAIEDRLGGKLGRILTGLTSIILILFFIHASWPGTEMVLTGLSAYHRDEVMAINTLSDLYEGEVMGDLHTRRLLTFYNISQSGLGVLEELPDDSLLVLTENNLEEGFLIGYDWVSREAILGLETLAGGRLTYNSGYIQAWLRR